MNVLDEILDYDDIYSNSNAKFRMKKPTLAHEYKGHYKFLTADKSPKTVVVMQSATKDNKKLKYSLDITEDGKKADVKVLEKLLEKLKKEDE
jgi:hypothetical protein